MSRQSHDISKEIQGKEDLIEWFRQHCKPADQQLVGVEHEKPPFYRQKGHAPVPYKGVDGKPGLYDFLEKMVKERGWIPNYEKETLVELQKDDVSWSLEPGGQMETSGAPLKNVHQTAKETDANIAEAIEVSKSLGIGMVALGYHPTNNGDHMPEVPKSRYTAWREFLEEKYAEHATDGVNCTSALQVNLGYESEEDMVKMLRVALSLQPVAMALFANSPFSEGKPSGYQSTRSEVLHGNMGGRQGFMLPVAFEKDFGFEKFVDYAMKMPLLGVYKDDVFVDVKGATFTDFMEGKVESLKDHKPTLADWENHLNTIWPEVRVRGYLEMRGADNGPAEMIKALPAFWVGLLYDKKSLDAAYEMVRDWTDEDREYLRRQTPRTGLQTPFMGTTVQELAKNCLALSEAGLKHRAIKDDKGNDESVYLAPLREIAESGKNWALRLLERYYDAWKGDIDKVFEEQDYARNPSVLKTPAPADAPKADAEKSEVLRQFDKNRLKESQPKPDQAKPDEFKQSQLNSGQFSQNRFRQTG